MRILPKIPVAAGVALCCFAWVNGAAEPGPAADEPKPIEAAIKVLAAQPSGPPISRRLFGKFTEHLGRNVYGGAWAQLVENPGFEPATVWPNADLLRRHLQYTQRSRNVRGLAAAIDEGLAPWWMPIEQSGAEFHLKAEGINGTFQQMTTKRPTAGLRTLVFLPNHRARRYQLSIWAFNSDPQGNSLQAGFQRIEDGSILVEAEGNLPPGKWQKLQLTLELPESAMAEKSEPFAFCLRLKQPGTVRLDQCLLFPADHVDGWDPEIVNYLREGRLPLLRFPGGNFASGYDWRDGIGPLDQRPVRPNRPWNQVEWNHVGTPEWLRLCELVGAEALICVNAGDGTPEEAAAWVEYCNGAEDTPMGKLRAAHGRRKPYAVKLWEVGNEIWGNWQIGHTDAAGYAARYGRFAPAMWAADRSIELIACGHSADWNREVLRQNPDTVRSLSAHELSAGHVPADADPREVYLDLVAHLKWYRGEIQRRTAPMTALGLTPRLAITELMIHSGRPGLPNNYSLAEALRTAGIYNLAIRSQGQIELITHTALINHGGGFSKRAGRIWPHPVWWTTHLYSTQPGTQPVTVNVSTPTFENPGKWLPKVKQAPYLDAAALLDASGKELVLLVVNFHPEQPITTKIELHGFQPAATATVSVLGGESYTSTNSARTPTNVQIERSTADVDTPWSFRFRRHSLTRLQFQRRDRK